MYHRTTSVIENVEHETCCLAFTATSDGWLTNKLTTFSPTTLPRRMKCRPRARCNTRRPFQTRRNRSRHQHSTQQTHFTQRYHEEVHQRKRVQRLPGCSDFQRLVAGSGLKSSDAKVHGDFLLDSARKSSGEGPLQSRHLIAGFKEPTEKGHGVVGLRMRLY